MTMDKAPVTMDQLELLTQLKGVLEGSRIVSVSYVPLDVNAGTRRSWSSRRVHEIDLDVIIVLETRRLRISWARDDRVEGLALTLEDKTDPVDPLLPPPVIVDSVPGWKSMVGSLISAVAVAWQQSDNTRPPSLWSLRLSVSGGGDVVVALGELDETTEDLLYHPDSLLVIFDKPAATSYESGVSSGSAWGSALLGEDGPQVRQMPAW